MRSRAWAGLIKKKKKKNTRRKTHQWPDERSCSANSAPTNKNNYPAVPVLCSPFYIGNEFVISMRISVWFLVLIVCSLFSMFFICIPVSIQKLNSRRCLKKKNKRLFASTKNKKYPIHSPSSCVGCSGFSARFISHSLSASIVCTCVVCKSSSTHSLIRLVVRWLFRMNWLRSLIRIIFNYVLV